MNFDEFLNIVAPKIGPKNAFDLARDSRIKALERSMIENLGLKAEDIERIAGEELQKLAENIQKMPPPPSR